MVLNCIIYVLSPVGVLGVGYWLLPMDEHTVSETSEHYLTINTDVFER